MIQTFWHSWLLWDPYKYTHIGNSINVCTFILLSSILGKSSLRRLWLLCSYHVYHMCIFSYLQYALPQMASHGHQVAGVYTLLMQPPTHQTCVSHSPCECLRPPEIRFGGANDLSTFTPEQCLVFTYHCTVQSSLTDLVDNILILRAN